MEEGLKGLDWSRTRGKEMPLQMKGAETPEEEPQAPAYMMEASAREGPMPGEEGWEPPVAPPRAQMPWSVTEVVNTGTACKRGSLALWCDSCGEHVDIDIGEFKGCCPGCGAPIMKQKCIRCGYEWWPKDPTRLPGTCPKCKSPYYNRRRVK